MIEPNFRLGFVMRYGYLLGIMLIGSPLFAQNDSLSLEDVKKSGWMMTKTLLDNLGIPKDNTQFPGVFAWFDSLKKVAAEVDSKKPVAEWPGYDVEKEITRNPLFWQMFYETAPLDPSLAMLHAYLLQIDGSTERSSYLLVIAAQVPGVPKEYRKLMRTVVLRNNATLKEPNKLTQEGIALHDQNKFDEAIAKYNFALKVHPKFGLAYYERGYSERMKQWDKVGYKPPAKQISINDDTIPKDLPAVLADFEATRKHNPLEHMAYQGSDKEIIKALQVLVRKGKPAWRKMEQAMGDEKLVDDKVVQDVAEAMQAIGAHDLALAARQVMVIRRGRFAPDNYPFIEKSLKALAQGEAIDSTLKKLNSDQKMALKQFTKMDPVKVENKETKKPDFAEILQVKLLNPIPELDQRIGSIDAFADFVKLNERTVDEIFKSIPSEQITAKGLNLFVAIQAKKEVKVWVVPVEGELSEKLIRQVETAVAGKEAFDPKNPVVCYCLQMGLYKRGPKNFEAMPKGWKEAMEKQKSDLPTQEFLKALWDK